MTYSEDQIVGMGLTPKATYGGNVVSFTCAATGDYVWPIEVLTDLLSVIQRRTNRLVGERNKKLRALFAAQSKAGPKPCPAGAGQHRKLTERKTP